MLPLLLVVGSGALLILLYQGKDTTDTLGQAFGAPQFTMPFDWERVKVLTSSDLQEGKGYWVVPLGDSFAVKSISISSDLIIVEKLATTLTPKDYSFMTANAFRGFAGKQVYYVTKKGNSIQVITFTDSQIADIVTKGNFVSLQWYL